MATYSDTFDRADAANLGSNWAEGVGSSNTIGKTSHKIGGNAALPSSTSSGAFSLWNTALTTDHYSEVVIGAVNGTSQGPIVRANSSSSASLMYRAYYDGSSIKIATFPAGTAIASSAPLTLHAGDTLRLAVQGQQLTAYVNGTQVAQGTDTSNYATTGTYAGIRTFDSAGLASFASWTGGDVTTAQVVALGKATETDAARALTTSGSLTVALGRATETDAARALTRAGIVTVPLGRAVEQDDVVGAYGSGDYGSGDFGAGAALTPVLTPTVAPVWSVYRSGAFTPATVSVLRSGVWQPA